MASKPPAPKRSSRPDGPGRWAAVVGTADNWVPADDGLDSVRAVPTDFLGLNRGTRCGGLPVGRIVVVYGPSHEGKTAVVLGLASSYLRRDLLVGYMDCERALDRQWASSIVGGLGRYPNFVVPPSESLVDFEDMMSRADEFYDLAARSYRTFDNYPGSLLILDSLDSIQPRSLLAAALGDFSKHTAKDRKNLQTSHDHVTAGNLDQRKANVNRGWLARCVGQAAATHTTLVVVCHESVYVEGFGKFAKMRRKARGGHGVKYMSSLFVNVAIDDRILTDADGKPLGKGASRDARRAAVLVGTRFRAVIEKNKVGDMDGESTTCSLHMATGKGTSPCGIDHAREAIAEGLVTGVVERRGSFFYHGDDTIGQGEQGAVDALNADADRLSRIIGEIAKREEFERVDAR